MSRIEHLKYLPAVQWKLQNIQKLLRENPRKHAKMLAALEEALLGR